MTPRLLVSVLASLLALSVPLLAQNNAPAGDKKAAPPKSPADLAADAFYALRNDPAAKLDQGRMQRVVAAGMACLVQFPTHGRAAGTVQDMADFASDRMPEPKLAAQRLAYIATLRYEILNQKSKDDVSDDTRTALAALDAAAMEYELRDAPTAPNLDLLREKIDTLTPMKGSGRFLVEREREYARCVQVMRGAARGETYLTGLLEHTDKGVAAMARQELNILELKKTPYALKFTALDGQAVDFEKLRGKAVVMYFFSSTNPGSVRQFEALKLLHSTYRKKGLEVIGVSFDKEEDKDKLAKMVKEQGLAFPIYFDGKGSKNDFSPKLNINRTPAIAMWDAKGLLMDASQTNVRLERLEPNIKRALGIK